MIQIIIIIIISITVHVVVGGEDPKVGLTAFKLSEITQKYTSSSLEFSNC